MPTATVDEFLPHGEGIRAALRGEKPEARKWNSGQIGRDTLAAPFIRSSSGRRAAKTTSIPDSIFCISGFSILPPG